MRGPSWSAGGEQGDPVRGRGEQGLPVEGPHKEGLCRQGNLPKGLRQRGSAWPSDEVRTKKTGMGGEKKIR